MWVSFLELVYLFSILSHHFFSSDKLNMAVLVIFMAVSFYFYLYVN